MSPIFWGGATSERKGRAASFTRAYRLLARVDGWIDSAAGQGFQILLLGLVLYAGMVLAMCL